MPEQKKKGHNLPDEGYVRIWQIVGGKGYAAVIPVCKSAWWQGVKTGRFPQPVKLGKRTTVWRVQDIRALIENKE